MQPPAVPAQHVLPVANHVLLLIRDQHRGFFIKIVKKIEAKCASILHLTFIYYFALSTYSPVSVFTITSAP
jgi:hypothetical protein